MVQEFRYVQKSEVVEGLKGEEQNRGVNAKFDPEPGKLLGDRSDVIDGGGSGEDTVMIELRFYGWTCEGDQREGSCSNRCVI